MKARLANWWRGFRLDLAHRIMDKRDRDTIIELGNITKTIVDRLGWKFVHDLHYRRIDVIIDEQTERIH